MIVRMSEITPHLFVYGTLMSGATTALGQAERARLAAEARLLGPATMAAARLYDLGRYPGLAETGDAADTVHGEALILADPPRTLAWLDDYEGVIPGDYNLSEYARIERQIRLAHGAELAAWVYIFRRDAAALRPITGGRWERQQG
jgi:gamma-glutamylcyclotransferase (GGCT)/AIG2-like uncharacterized protein YtfP